MTVRSKIIVLLFPVLFTGLALFTSPWWLRERHAPASDLKKVVVTRRIIHRTVVSSGTVKPQVGAEVKVGSRTSGTVKRLFVQVGDRVEKGDVVATIEHEDLLSMVRQAEAVLNSKKAQLYEIQQTRPKEINRARALTQELEARLDLAQLTRQRQRSLRKGDYVPQESVDQAEKEVIVLQSQLLSARENLALLEAKQETDLQIARAQVAESEAALENAAITLSYATIRAPISGVVGSISTQEGETVAASLNAPTFITLIDLERLQVDNYVDETDIGLVRLGQEAHFTVDAYPDVVFKGVVEAIYPMATIQEKVVYYDVIIRILKPVKAILRPEMTANVRIIVDTHLDALSLPSEAIVRMKGKRWVTVEDSKGETRPRQVTVGWVDQGYTEILSGLEAGETVVIGVPMRDEATG